MEIIDCTGISVTFNSARFLGGLQFEGRIFANSGCRLWRPQFRTPVGLSEPCILSLWETEYESNGDFVYRKLDSTILAMESVENGLGFYRVNGLSHPCHCRKLGRVLVKLDLYAQVAECPLRSESGRIVSMPRNVAMGQKQSMQRVFFNDRFWADCR
jgi:hypothetical protein